MSKKMGGIILFIIVILIIIVLPWVNWHRMEATPLDVLIIDKTVPNDSYREHKGITWALNHFKYMKEDNTTYELETDYIGFYPLANQNFETRSIVDTNVEGMDMIYMADTYGVYEHEFFQEHSDGLRSELIYGGLSHQEMDVIENILYNEKIPFVAEFNSFASPTDQAVTERLTRLLGISWDGWIARYFDELDPNQNDEIPVWVIENYQSNTGEAWDYDGSGLVFVSDSDQIIVLEQDIDFSGDGVGFDFTEAGEAYFDGAWSSQYDYWFDIITPEGAEVLAEYDLNLTASGIELLSEVGVNGNLPAVLKDDYFGAPVYYFAGDYADLASTPRFYEYSGLSTLAKYLTVLQRSNPNQFYYRSYLPMIETILSRAADEKPEGTLSAHTFNNGDVSYPSQVNGKQIEVYRNGEWESITIKGINMGMAKPGYWPGEGAISFDEYYRWLNQMLDMGVNVLRVYTIHPPEFYQALALVNEGLDEPLYLMHGVWIEEEHLEETLDAFTEESILPFEAEMNDVIDVIHGNITIPENPGHASGQYLFDISDYVIGWIIGIEWYPQMVDGTNLSHEDIGEFNGEFLMTQGANPFEHWLAARMEHMIAYEVEQYQSMRPISFTNWPTTDMLTHPTEPSEDEDLVSIDPNHIKGTDRLAAGYFASYHVYPYYPEFLNLEEDYVTYVDHRGELNNYAGYLNELIEAHEMPVVIAEFGVPNSRGQTHRNPFGWNQGFLSEQEQGEIVVRLFDDLLHEGAAGGMVFTWQDEWFKRTWNTMDLDNPYRRPYWSNVQTNEQRFGLVGFESFKKPLDGDWDKWDTDPDVFRIQSNDGMIESLLIDHDEAFLYFALKMDPNQFDRDRQDVRLFLDLLPDLGSEQTPFSDSITFDSGVEFIIDVPSNGASRVWVDAYYDVFYYLYIYELNFLDESEEKVRNSGVYHPINFALNKPMTIPSTGEDLPFEYYETGLLTEGIGSPEEPDYNSLSDYYYDPSTGLIEFRIPWLMLNIKDPSQKEAMGNLWETGVESSMEIERVNVTAMISEDQNILDLLPALEEEQVGYSWEKWELPTYNERLKKSYDILRDYFINLE